jgi:hypothetical protein
MQRGREEQPRGATMDPPRTTARRRTAAGLDGDAIRVQMCQQCRLIEVLSH